VRSGGGERIAVGGLGARAAVARAAGVGACGHLDLGGAGRRVDHRTGLIGSRADRAGGDPACEQLGHQHCERGRLLLVSGRLLLGGREVVGRRAGRGRRLRGRFALARGVVVRGRRRGLAVLLVAGGRRGGGAGRGGVVALLLLVGALNVAGLVAVLCLLCLVAIGVADGPVVD